MKKVLVLGAGLVAKPLIDYLAEAGEANLTVVDIDAARVDALVRPHGAAVGRTLDIRDDAALDDLVKGHDVVVSLLPAGEHVRVARICLANGRHMTTASYVSPEMRELDAPAAAAELTFVNECGLDPGLDHMSALRRIHEINLGGGVVVAFRSYCGGLPAPEANTNPIGYKFSWAPRGVLSAAAAPARYLHENEVVEVAAPDILADPEIVNVPGLGDFEGYPNRDSLPYVEIYGLDRAETMFRGTLRNVGHCRTWHDWGRLGLFDDTPRDDLAGLTYRSFVLGLAGGGDDPGTAVASALGVAVDSPSVTRLEWLGLFEDSAISTTSGGNVDVMADIMAEKCPYEKGERDMILMRHDFVATFGGATKRYSSSLVAYGEPHGDSAMARTVSLPLAVATEMVLRGDVAHRGVVRPVFPDFYNPILRRLEAFDITFEEAEE
jgi:saccharopine dehydrogenase-like NADP-dependent oxidoreductase